MTRRGWLRRTSAFAALLALSSAGCRTREEEKATGEPSDLPPLVFRADTPNLMLTWIDPQGGTHVEGAPDQVPEAARDFVRVVLSDQREGATDPIYVADLTQSTEGSYTARSLPRRAWEEEIARRRSRGEVASNPPADRPPRSRRPEPNAPRDPQPAPSGPKMGGALSHLSVIVYGADWCKPCHEALDHLKSRGIKPVFKDIDKDAVANAEMVAKLERGRSRRGVIPVIDVDGQILVGYSRATLDRALAKASEGTML